MAIRVHLETCHLADDGLRNGDASPRQNRQAGALDEAARAALGKLTLVFSVAGSRRMSPIRRRQCTQTQRDRQARKRAPVPEGTNGLIRGSDLHVTSC